MIPYFIVFGLTSKEVIEITNLLKKANSEQLKKIGELANSIIKTRQLNPLIHDSLSQSDNSDFQRHL